jgi:hypothetical protein
VYRELATELKTTQITVEALTQQNQQLLRQNKLLRTEIQRFVQAAEQLGHFAGVIPSEPIQAHQEEPRPPQEIRPTEKSAPQHVAEIPFRSEPVSPSKLEPPQSEVVVPTPSPKASVPNDTVKSSASSAIVPHPKERKRPPKPSSATQKLYTEQPEGMHPLSRVASRADMSNLWLATTILLVVVSAFGAGFLIMRPLLNNR